MAVSVLAVARVGAAALPGTAELREERDWSSAMVEGIGRHLDAETRRVREARVTASEVPWREAELRAKRERLARIIGAVDARVQSREIDLLATAEKPARVAETETLTVDAVRWAVFDGVQAEGLWLRPKGEVVARVVAAPDADQPPEALVTGYAGQLAASGCEVLVPTLVDRGDRFSGNAAIGRQTNQPHREWIYRQAFVLGRHIIGYEVQKVLAAVDRLERRNGTRRVPIGVAGWGEGGLIALHAAALDPRIEAAAVSGYFGPRERVWEEPIYRNVWGLLREFGDAELAQLIAPRTLVIEPTRGSEVSGPPAASSGRAGAAPGKLATSEIGSVRDEVERARALAGAGARKIIFATSAQDDEQALTGDAGRAFAAALGVTFGGAARAPEAGKNLITQPDMVARQERQVRELERFTQRLWARSAEVREEFLWKKVKPVDAASWAAAMAPYRERLANDVIGRIAAGEVPLNPRSRLVMERPAWRGYDVVLDVAPEVFAWGLLLMPRDLMPGERRPVVVVQHGLEGLPADTVDEDVNGRAYRYYKAFGARLAERGFIVFAPHNPYRGETTFRMLQRKANPLGLSLFSFIVAQHGRILEWLAARPEVDAARIGFYGLSYGGKTAMRVPPLLERYAAVVCSGDFNEWVWKTTTVDWRGSYMFTREWEIPEWDLGSTFNYAEMAALIAPRPFMVERGHDDGVGTDEWVAFEYAKVRRLYQRLGIPERTEIEFFAGPHTIHGGGTFRFLHRHLNWPEPGTR